MSLVNSRELLKDAQAHGYAVGAFNVENMEMMQAVIAAAAVEAEDAPLMLQTTPSTLRYADTAVFTAMARAIAGKAKVPVAIHLDHGDSLEVKPGEDIYTDPGEASRFVDETGIDSLAVAIGTAHGFYKGKPKLDFDRLAQLRDAVSVPLVLHGSSGVPDEDVQRAISLGACKVNFATELRVA